MISLFKKKKNLLLENKKYNDIYYVYNKDIFDTKFILLLKPVTVLTYDEQEVLLPRGSVVHIVNSCSSHKHEDIITIQHIESVSGLLGLFEDFFWDDNPKYLINRNFIIKYGMPYTKDLKVCIKSFNNDSVLNWHLSDVIKYSTSRLVFDVVYKLIDIFANFETVIVNQFSNSIVDSITNLVNLLSITNDNWDKQELLFATKDFIDEIHETMCSFGENIEMFPSPRELIDEKAHQEFLARKEYEEKVKKEKALYNSQKSHYLEAVKYKRELLQDFNEPVSKIPDNMMRKNKEIDEKMKKMGLL